MRHSVGVWYILLKCVNLLRFQLQSMLVDNKYKLVGFSHFKSLNFWVRIEFTLYEKQILAQYKWIFPGCKRKYFLDMKEFFLDKKDNLFVIK